MINNYLNDISTPDCDIDLSWLDKEHTNVKMKLLCGGDLLESFDTPGVWTEEDVRFIHILKLRNFDSSILLESRFSMKIII